MRSTLRATQRGAPPPCSKRTVLTQPVPTSMPAVRVAMGILLGCGLVHHRAPGEGGPAERPGVDGVGVDVDGHVAVVLLHQLAQLADRRLVLGDAAGEGELIPDA